MVSAQLAALMFGTIVLTSALIVTGVRIRNLRKTQEKMDEQLAIHLNLVDEYKGMLYATNFLQSKEVDHDEE